MHQKIWFVVWVFSNNLIICFGTIISGMNKTTTLPITLLSVFAYATGSSRQGSVEAWACSIQSISTTSIVSNSYTQAQHNYNPPNYILIGQA